MNTILKLAAGLTLLFSIQAQAKGGGFFVEPYLNYAVSGSLSAEIETDLPATIETDEDLGGLAYGLKIGGVASGFLFGAEYSILDFTGKDKDDVADDNDYEATGLGAFFGYAFTPEFRTTFSYYFDLSNDDDGVEASGTGMKIGFHYQVANYLNLGLDYLMIDFNEIDPEDITGPPAFSITDYSNTGNAIMLTVGFPFMF